MQTPIPSVGSGQPANNCYDFGTEPPPAALFLMTLAGGGQAVVKMWGRLPPDLQSQLFEEAATSQDQEIRPHLAIYLHEKHSRTCAGMQARAMLEPDSLGG